MINWKTMSDLLVIKKLEQLVGRWFGVEMFYTDPHGRIQSNILDKHFEFKGHFMKVQMGMGYGHQYLVQDIDGAVDAMEVTKAHEFASFFPGVRGMASKVMIDGEAQGMVFVYPFIKDDVTSDEVKALMAKMIECGASESDAKMCIDKMKRLTHEDCDYLREVVELVADEISTFHEEMSKREDRIGELNSELGAKFRFHNMIGKSKAMQHIYRLLEKISSSESTILIQGENGTGKELVAKAIHYGSPRKDNVFLAQNCSAFNDNLLDSELFGHVKGAFTGAVKDKKGLFEAANGGTLFLDEIGDTSLSMQVKLLRVLQEGTFLPVGSTTPKKVNVRVIAATNKNLKEMIAKGEFREDFYYRINVINVTLPPLRERKDDIPILIDTFMEKRCAEMGVPTKKLANKTLERILDYAWPGNVRELENEVERLVVLSGDAKVVTPDILNSRILDSGMTPSSVQGVKTTGSLKDALEELETFMIKEGLRRCNWNKSKLAKELGISRAGLIMKVEKYGLDKRAVAKKAAGDDVEPGDED